MAEVTIRFFAAARAAAGQNVRHVELSESMSLAVMIDSLGAHDTGLAEVLANCTFLVNAEASTTERMLTSGDVVDVLPPFAGG